MTLEEIRTRLKSTLGGSRYLHSLSVADTARDLALRYGADPDKAYLAGLVHDCAKHLEEEELMERISCYGIDLDKQTLLALPVLHSFVGAYEAREVFGIDDEEVFDAVYYHTVGKEDMPLITKIIYLADAIEPLRCYPGVDAVREAAETSLDRAVWLYTRGTVDYVRGRGGFLHPNALRVEAFYHQRTGKE